MKTQIPPYQPQPQKSHSRVSVWVVLKARFCRWLEKATMNDVRRLLKSWLEGLCIMLVAFAYAAPSYAMGVALDALKWNQFRVPVAVTLFTLTINSPKIIRYILRKKKRVENQHTFHGVPITELADYLLNNKSFTTHARKDLALAQRQFDKIAKALEGHEILVRDKNNGNARVLNTIDRHLLVRQLKEDFPLVYDRKTKSWLEKGSRFDNWCRTKDKQEVEDKRYRETNKIKWHRRTLDETPEKTSEEPESRLACLWAA